MHSLVSCATWTLLLLAPPAAAADRDLVEEDVLAAAPFEIVDVD